MIPPTWHTHVQQRHRAHCASGSKRCRAFAIVAAIVAPMSAHIDDAAAKPQGQDKDAQITVVAGGFTLDRITDKLNEQGMHVQPRSSANALKVTAFIVRNVTPEVAMDRLMNATTATLIAHHPLDHPELTELWTEADYRSQVLPKLVVRKTYTLKNTQAENVARQVMPFLTPGLSRTTYDDRTGKVFISDLPESHSRIELMIEELDVELYTRVFNVKHSDVGALAENLKRLCKSDRAYPIIDERTRQIIVRERLDTIRQMELLVKTFDIPTPSNGKEAKSAAQNGEPIHESKSRAGETEARPVLEAAQSPAPDPSRSENMDATAAGVRDASQSSAVSPPGGRDAQQPGETAVQTSAAF